MASSSSAGIQDPAVPSCKELLPRELLPRIPLDIAWSLIVTKLSWSDLRAMLGVNRTWKSVIRSREVYRQRMNRNSTETLVAIKHADRNFPASPKFTISLYSMRDNAFYQLPPVPHLRGISRYSQLISQDGKLYVGMADSRCQCCICSRNCNGTDNQVMCTADMDRLVYVLDLAAQGQWEKYPKRLPTAVEKFQCEGDHTTGRYCKFGSNLYWQGGCRHLFSSLWFRSHPTESGEISLGAAVPPAVALSMDIRWNKVWRIEGKMYRTSRADGKYHVLELYDNNSKSWAFRHSISYDGVDEIERQIRVDSGVEPGLEHQFTIDPVSVIGVNHELLALSMWTMRYSVGYILLQSRGFGSESGEIVWEKAPNSFSIDFCATSAMCPIEL